MRRGNERLETLRSSIGVPRERVLGRAAEKTIAGDSPQTSSFTERPVSGYVVQEAPEHEASVETHAHIGGCCESAGCGKAANLSVGALSNFKIPRLVCKKIKVEGTVPRTLVLRPRSAAIEEQPHQVQPPLQEPPIVQQEQSQDLAPVEESPTKQVVTVVPTPRKTRVRTPKLEKNETAPVPAPKPLKVIRRRREETPKVFETAAKSFPRAMLEGVNIESGENNHRQMD